MFDIAIAKSDILKTKDDSFKAHIFEDLRFRCVCVFIRNKKGIKIKKILLINLLFANSLFSGIMSMPMGLISEGAQAGLSMPIAKDMVDESKTFMTGVYTKRNYALRDKIYLYGSIQNKTGNKTEDKIKKTNKKKNSYLSKILLEKSFQFDKDIFIHIGGIASYKSEDDKNVKIRLHSFYYDIDFFVNLLNIKVGRDVTSFGYGEHFKIIDFLSPNNSLYNMGNIFLEKNSADALKIRINSTSGNNYMSMYAYENDISDDIENSNYLLEVSASKKSFKSSMFINKSDDNLTFALAFRGTIGKSLDMQTSIRYDKSDAIANENKSLASSSTISYYISKNFLIAFDYGAWKKDIKENNKDIVFHSMIYTKFKIAGLKIKTGYLKDNEEKTNLSLSYNIDNTKLYLDAFINAKNSEKNMIRFMVSYTTLN